MTTTETYAKANPELKRVAIERATVHVVPTTTYDSTTRSHLLDFLTGSSEPVMSTSDTPKRRPASKEGSQLHITHWFP